MSTCESMELDMEIDDLCGCFNTVNVTQSHHDNNDLITYITNLDIDHEIKNTIENLIYNDNYSSYANIYDICVENNIELPPL